MRVMQFVDSDLTASGDFLSLHMLKLLCAYAHGDANAIRGYAQDIINDIDNVGIAEATPYYAKLALERLDIECEEE